MYQNVINYLATVDYAQAVETVSAFLAAGGGLSVFIQIMKKARKWESGAFIQLMLGTFGLLVAAADVVLKHSNAGDPLALLFGQIWPSLVVAAMIMHRIAVNPLTKLIEQNIAGTIRDAKAYRAEKAVTVDGTIAPAPDQFN